MNKKIYSAKEHSIVDNDFNEEMLKEFNQRYKDEDPKFLGLHQEFDNNEVKLKSHYYIGYRWVDEQKDKYIHIAPKKSGDKQADYLKMFLTCLKDPIVSKHLSETYKICFDEKWIDTQNEEDEITPLLILQFLQVIKNISKKGLKKGYVKVTQNLTSKIKGRILVNSTIKQNHFRNRIDKTVCDYQIFTIDCIENKILKTALLQCSRHLHTVANDNKDIVKLLKYNLNTFELVNKKEIFESDFSKIKHSPFYKEYKEALNLAKMIFKLLGFTLSSSQQKHKSKIPPFYIDMPELFERYVEVKLRECDEYKNGLTPGYGHKNGNSYKWGLRPDFIVKDKKLIIDAKYKYWFSKENEDEKFKNDYQQLSLYGRDTDIRRDIKLSENEEAKLLFIYPKFDKDENIDIDDNDICCPIENVGKFSNIQRIEICIPKK